jgi:hypothetical protein
MNDPHLTPIWNPPSRLTAATFIPANFEIDDLKRKLALHPDLCIDGLRYNCHRPASPYSDARFPERRSMFLKPNYLHQVETACEYLYHLHHSRLSDMEQIGSYGLKHRIEDWGRKSGFADYVTNGCAILGAVLSGYALIHERDSPNCSFRKP